MSTRPNAPEGGFTDQARTEQIPSHPSQQPYGGQPHYQQGHPLPGQHSGGGDGISAGDLARVARREFLTRETKPGLFTSEFLSSAIVAICILVAAAIVDGGDAFSAKEAWTLVTALSIGYMISRGLAKSGVRHASQNDDRGL